MFLSLSLSFSVCLFAVCCFLLFDKKRIKPKSKTLSSFCANESIKIVSRMKLNEKTADSLSLSHSTPFLPRTPTWAHCVHKSKWPKGFHAPSVLESYLLNFGSRAWQPALQVFPFHPSPFLATPLRMRQAHSLAKGIACFCLFVIYATFLISSRKNEFSRTQPLDSSKPNSCEIT